MTIQQLPVYTGEIPALGQEQSQFNTNVSDKLAYDAQLVPAQNTYATEANALAAQAQSDASDAESSAAAAASNSNFKGNWSDATGASNIPASYRHNGRNWQQLQNIADITTQEPSENSFWTELSNLTDSSIGELTNYQAASVADMIAGTPFSSNPVALALGQVWEVGGSQFGVNSISAPVTISNFRAFNNPTIFSYGGKVDGSTDDTQAFLGLLGGGHQVIEMGVGTMILNSELIYALTSDLTINGNDCVIKSNSSSPAQTVVYLTSSGHNLTINDLTFDADNKCYQAIRIQNESNADIKDVTLNNVKALNAYRSGQAFQGGDGIFIRGGFRRVILNNPIVKSVKMATGAGIPGSEGVSGITAVQNFAQTLMPRHVEINNPYVEDIYSEDNTYTADQDGAKLFGLDTEFMEEGSCRINGGSFKNCWGRSLKFQRPDAVVNGTAFIRDQGNATGSGNSEVDFQRGGGTVRDIICKYTNFNPATIVNTYQNQYDTYKFLVDGISVSLEGTTLTSIVQRFSQATPDKAIPLITKNVNVVGSISQILRYLTQNSSTSNVKEQAVLENIYFEQANVMAQVYGNNTGQRVDIYAKNVNTSGVNVNLIDEGEFSNAVEVRLYQDYIRGFNSYTDSFFTTELTAQSGSVTLNSNENRLHYMRKGRVVSVYGQVRVISVSAPTGSLSLKLPFPSQRGSQLSSVVSSSIVVSGSASKNCNDFSLDLTFDSDTAFLQDISGNVIDGASVAQQMQNNTRLYVSFQYVAEDDF